MIRILSKKKDTLKSDHHLVEKILTYSTYIQIVQAKNKLFIRFFKRANKLDK